MTLTPEQKQTVSGWISSGASIADVQKRLREEFQLSLTYIDTRFLIDDLGLNLKSAPPPKTKAPADLAVGKNPGAAGANKPGLPTTPSSAASADTGADAEYIDDGEAFAEGADEFADDAAAEPAAGIANVKVEIDRVMRPGTVVSGAVTFSDGKTGKWALDQMGRLMFESSVPGYRPSQGDLQVFQRELSTQLQRHGF
jgi:hypothetical protein